MKSNVNQIFEGREIFSITILIKYLLKKKNYIKYFFFLMFFYSFIYILISAMFILNE